MKLSSRVKDYSLEVVDGAMKKKSELLAGLNYDRLFFFVDAGIGRLHADLANFVGDDFCLAIEAREENKEYLELAKFYAALVENGITRRDILVTIGGGILQDISGFIASTLYRGIRWIYLPTTLLAQADSCIGSKTSINFGQNKNLIGSFYPPDRIFIDPAFCKTLSDEYFNSGLGEIIKFHLMSDAKGYAFLRRYLGGGKLRDNPLLNELIISTLMIKRSYFEDDEFDTGRRNLLNYGHCFGHALESASNFAVCHGEAVIMGMGFANLLSLKRNIITREKYEELEELLKGHYPRFDLSAIEPGQLIHYLKKDKKRVGKGLTMVLSRGPGRQEKWDDITEEEITETYHEFAAMHRSLKGTVIL